MNVADVMSTGVEFIDPSATVQATAELMGEIDVGALPVGDAVNLEGLVTDRDILYRVVAAGLDPATTKIRAILSRPVITCRDRDTLQMAMDLMAANHIRRLPVVDGADTVIGWVTLADIARRMLVEDAGLQKTLQELTG